MLSWLILFSLHLPPATASAEEAIIIHPDVEIDSLSNNAVRAIFGMRLRNWPSDKPIKVFVLKDTDPTHARFAKQNLSIFPHQLRRAWDRLVYSGAGQAPIQVDSEEEMRARVAATDGAIGYLSPDKVDGSVRVVELDR